MLSPCSFGRRFYAISKHSISPVHRRCGVIPVLTWLGTGGSTAVAHAAEQQHMTLQQYDDFELLWLEYRHNLSLSKTACEWALQDVQQGLLPCDADLLRSRAAQVAGLGRQSRTKIDALRILNNSKSILSYDVGHLQRSVSRLIQLLPNANPTQLILATTADLDMSPEVLALHYQELDMLFTSSLGAHITAEQLHYLLTRLRKNSSSGGQHPSLESSAGRLSAVQQVLHTPSALTEQLQSLAALLSPELAHVVLQDTPQLLDAKAEQLQANLQWLQHQLQLSPVAAMLLAEACGELLLLPTGQLEQNYVSLQYLLTQLLGWRVQQVRTAVCNAPQLLATESKQCASNWHRVQQLARRRLTWLRELAETGAVLVTKVLCARPVQLTMLQYAADTGDLRGTGLVQVLQMNYIDFVAACPGFRTWRAMAPGRWKYFKTRSESSDEHDAVTAAGHASSSVVGDADSKSDGSTVEQHRVLAVDKYGCPVLIAVGSLGPYDRLA